MSRSTVDGASVPNRWYGTIDVWRRAAWSAFTKVSWLRRASFIDFPIDWASLLASIAACIVLTWLLNANGLREIRSAYSTHVPTVLQGARSTNEAVSRLIDAGWGDIQIRDWLASSVEADQRASDLLLRLSRQVASQEKNPQLTEATLRRWATGDPRGVFPFPSLTLNTPGGADLLDELLRVDGFLKQGLASDPLGDQKRELLRRLGDDLLAATRPGIRNVRRWNGSCQWLTIVITVFALIVVVRRSLLLDRLQASRSTRDPADEPVEHDADLAALPRLLLANAAAGASHAEQTMLLQEESNRLSAAVEARVYDPLSFLTSCLPSLGFIGTVVGMGEALLLADSLFGSGNRQRVISAMTEQLGYAFDTTLVALLCGLLVGTATALVRRKDHRFLAEFETALVDRFLPHRVSGERVA